MTIGNWQLAIGNEVELGIFDIHGQKIRTLVDEIQPPGDYTVRFDGMDLPAGIYLVRLRVGEYIETCKMIIMR